MLQIDPFVKYLVLQTDLLYETKIIAESNFSIYDKKGIMRFINKYSERDDCVIVEVEM